MATEITATQVLDMLAKATKLGINYDVHPDKDGHSIRFEVDWYADQHSRWTYLTVFVTKDSQSWSSKGDYPFDTWSFLLDEELQKQKQNEEKAEKRKAILEKLTQEERELLGV